MRSRRAACRNVLVALAMMSVAGCGPRPPSSCAVRGIDVSHHQGTIDWHAVANDGVRFAWIKATEGGDHLDQAFRRNWELARAAGVRRGAYHFVYWCRPALDQARWFVSTVPADPAALPPVLDVEWTPGSKSCPQKVDRDKALAEMKTILDLMTRTYGRKPVIYAPDDLFHDVLVDALKDYPLWARSIGDDPPASYDRDWTIWQYSETGSVAGVRGAVDLNCFNGDERAWRAFLHRRSASG